MPSDRHEQPAGHREVWNPLRSNSRNVISVRRVLSCLAVLAVAQASAVVALQPPAPTPVDGELAAGTWERTPTTGPRTTTTATADARGLDLEVSAGPVEVDVEIGGDRRDDGPSDDVRCGDLDRPETGLRGDVPLVDQLSGRADEGYNCGLAVVGHDPIGERGSNGNMAWAGDCAYIAGDGIAVMDVSDPTAPRHVRTLKTPGSLDTLETLHAVEAEDRSILVAGRYGLFFDFQLQDSAPVDVYDVSECTDPQLLTTIDVPQSVHNLTLTADARTMWSTLPLQAYDLTDPARPEYLGNLENELRASGTIALEYAHEVWPSEDGTRIYLGGQVPIDERSYIIDVSQWPAGPARVVSTMSGPGHSVRTATVDGRRYLLRSEESVINQTANSCLPSALTPVGGVAEAFLTDITDETDPRPAGELGLEINRPRHCPAQLLSGVNASSHYHDVDDPDDTTFAMVSMWNAGLRIFDLRDPASPQEVAYFNPGRFPSPLGNQGAPLDPFLDLASSRTNLDQAWAHVRYRPDTGHIWLSTRIGGFWVLELEPQIRAALDLPEVRSSNPNGGPPRPPSSTGFARPFAAGTGGVYCTLGRL